MREASRKADVVESIVVPQIKIQRLRPNTLPLPRYHSDRAAGIDLMADVDDAQELRPLQRAAIPTGIALEIPPGFERDQHFAHWNCQQNRRLAHE